jgi:hypothetical protein
MFSLWVEVGLMANLTDLGFWKNAIVETIISTYNQDGKPNAAPMGAIMQNEQTVILRLFNSSLTLKNLQSSKCAVVNVTSKIELFYKTTFKETNPNGTLPQEWFEKAQIVNAPRLREADALIEVSVVGTNPIDTDRTQATCEVKMVQAPNAPPKAYCRAFSATLEAIVHATRVKAFVGNKNKREALDKLLTLIGDCNNVVNKTAPNSRYSEIMTELNSLIKSWRRANDESLH